MRTSLLVVTLASSLAFVGQMFAQESVPEIGPDEFRITQAMTLGSNGFQSETRFEIVDEHGVAYDTMSLLKDQKVREAIGISEEQYAEMSAKQAELESEMKETILAAAFDQRQRDELESMFLQMEGEHRASLSDQQRSGLAFARAKMGVDKVGADYLREPGVSEPLGISSEIASEIAGKNKSLREKLKSGVLEIRMSANKELIDSLTEDQRQQCKDLIPENESGFMVAELFPKNEFKRRKAVDRGYKQFSMLRLKSMQRKLKLSDDQIAEFKTLKRGDKEMYQQLEKLLSDEQFLLLNQQAIAGSAKSFGTVNTLASGVLGTELQLSDDESDQVFELGKNLNVKLITEVEELRKKLIIESFDIPGERAAAFSSLLFR